MNGPDSYKFVSRQLEHIFTMRPISGALLPGEPTSTPVHNHEERIELLLHALVCAVQANTAAMVEIDQRTSDGVGVRGLLTNIFGGTDPETKDTIWKPSPWREALDA